MQEAKLKSIELPNGETLGYRERDGGEQVLLLVHGNMNSSQHWDLVLENLDPRFKIYAVDQRGFGISTYNKPIESLQDLSEDLKLFVDALGLKRFSLAGWSTGGGVVMQFAADYPEYVEKLILLDSMSTRGYPFHETDENFVPDLTKRIKTMEQMLGTVRTKVVNSANQRRDKEFMQFLFNASVYPLKKPTPERYEAYLDDILTQRNLPEIYQSLNIYNISNIDGELTAGSGAVDRIKAPVLVMWGDHDVVVTRAMTDEIMEDFGDRARLVVLRNCGHSPLVDDIDQLCAEIMKFLGES